jgi:2'-5' RNA ligase
VHPEGVHITLKFLGDVAPQQTVEIAQQIADAASRSGRISLRTGAPGAFPSFRSPRVLWVGFEGETQRLVQLQGRVEGALGTLGFTRDKDRFAPHATTGRVNNEAQRMAVMRVGQAWEVAKLPPGLPEFTLNSVVLFRSQLGPGGARYEKLFEAPLS